jgi:hypothetical protein
MTDMKQLERELAGYRKASEQWQRSIDELLDKYEELRRALIVNRRSTVRSLCQ